MAAVQYRSFIFFNLRQSNYNIYTQNLVVSHQILSSVDNSSHFVIFLYPLCWLPPITSLLPTCCPGVVVFEKYCMAKFTLANITAFQMHSSSQKLLKFDCWILFYKFHTKLIFNSLVFSQILLNISTKLMSTSHFSNNNDKNNTRRGPPAHSLADSMPQCR